MNGHSDKSVTDKAGKPVSFELGSDFLTVFEISSTKQEM